MVLIQYLFSVSQRKIALGSNGPRKLGDGLDPTSDIARLGVMDREFGESVELFVRFFQNIFGEFGGFDLLAKFLDLAILFKLSELFLNGAHSLAKNCFFHIIVEFLLSFVEDLFLDLEDLDLFG